MPNSTLVQQTVLPGCRPSSSAGHTYRSLLAVASIPPSSQRTLPHLPHGHARRPFPMAALVVPSPRMLPNCRSRHFLPHPFLHSPSPSFFFYFSCQARLNLKWKHHRSRAQGIRKGRHSDNWIREQQSLQGEVPPTDQGGDREADGRGDPETIHENNQHIDTVDKEVMDINPKGDMNLDGVIPDK